MKVWLTKLHCEKHPDILQYTVRCILRVFSLPYAVVTSVRNFLYDRNIIKTYDPGVTTISVGNLTTGGTGKTPFTAELAKYYTCAGKKVGILSRGYGGGLDNKEVHVISDGEKTFYTAKEAGDEPFWLAENCRPAKVFTCRSRIAAAKIAVSEFGCDVLIADDGFQHRRLARNINLILVDAANGFGNELMLPAGPLRESLKNTERADCIVVTNKSSDESAAIAYCVELEKRFNKPVKLCKTVPENSRCITTGKLLPAGTRVIAFCAIAKPFEFFEFVKDDYTLVGRTVFEDHHAYCEEDLKKLFAAAEENGVDALITTEKDAVKVKDISEGFKTGIKIYAMKLKQYVDIGEIVNGQT